MKFIPLLYTVLVSILNQLVQDEALLSDWKQQLECDIETMKVQSNIVSVVNKCRLYVYKEKKIVFYICTRK